MLDSTVPLIEAFERICHPIAMDPSLARVPEALNQGLSHAALELPQGLQALEGA